MLKRGRLVTVEELQPGDVLLSKATRLYGWLIAGLDRSWYTHAAIWTGEGVIEAVPYSVVHWSLCESVNAKRRQFVDVFRWKHGDPAVLGAVVAHARGHEGKPYAMTDVLHMLHGIASSADPINVLRPKLPKLMADLREYESLGPRRGLTCSELVAKAFIGAGRPLHIELPTLDGTRSAGAPPRHPDPQLEELIALCRRLEQEERARNAGDAYRSAEAAAAGRDLFLVTPKDLSRSPSLVRVGRLRRTEEILRYETKQAPKPKPLTRTVPVAAVAQSRAPAMPPPSLAPPGPRRLLFIAAAPGHALPIDSDGELTVIGASLDRATYGEQIERCWPVLKATVADCIAAVGRERPTILHLAGHGSDLGLAAHHRTLNLADLLTILGRHASRQHLVVLNACSTAELALGLSAHVRVAVGMRGPIREEEAKSFASVLYLMLGTGSTIRAAFELARGELDDASIAVLAAMHEEDAQALLVEEPAEARENKAPSLAPTSVPAAAASSKSDEARGRRAGKWITSAIASLALALLAAFGARGHFQTTDVRASKPQPSSSEPDVSSPVLRPDVRPLAIEREPTAIETAPSVPAPKDVLAVAPSKLTPVQDRPLIELTAAGAVLHIRPLRTVHLHVVGIEPSGAATLLHASRARARQPLLQAAGGKTIVVIASERELDEVSPKHAALIRMVKEERRVPSAGAFTNSSIALGASGVSVTAKAHASGVVLASVVLDRPRRDFGAPKKQRAEPAAAFAPEGPLGRALKALSKAR